jgi:hypothetical protein
MFYEIASVARDWSIILLVLEGLVLLAAPLFVLLKITQGLRWLKPRLAPWMHKAHHYFVVADGVVQRGTTIVEKPFIWTQGAGRGLEGSTAALKRALNKES